MARVPLDIHNRGLLGRLAALVSRRMFGRVIEPAAAMAHHRGVLLATLRFERSVARRWTRLDPTLRMLAVMVVSGRIGCSWCVDFGYWEATHMGVDRAKIEDVPRWRDSTVYTGPERMVMEFAEAATATPPTVGDDLVTDLRRELGDAGVVELAALVALENHRSRFNAALGLTSQGFATECAVRPAGG